MTTATLLQETIDELIAQLEPEELPDVHFLVIGDDLSLTTLERVHPRVEGPGPGVHLQVGTHKIRFRVEEQTDRQLRVVSNGLRFVTYLSDLSPDAQEVYNQLRRDGMGPEAAEAAALLAS